MSPPTSTATARSERTRGAHVQGRRWWRPLRCWRSMPRWRLIMLILEGVLIVLIHDKTRVNKTRMSHIY
ncbi:unnamed protein product [Plutella xylostella]|uniref:(diamondback moth) hypothetical protein n=1 Tax=Plutella xylostella TaxID=51655 RepID=A0A8S4E0P0_PLUXY|nr:unnamed protein product [Plutella xylostella]